LMMRLASRSRSNFSRAQVCGPANPRAAAPPAMIADLGGGLGTGRVGWKADLGLLDPDRRGSIAVPAAAEGDPRN
jgi:hypothetical protein